MQNAIDWARDNAPDLAESIERELEAPRTEQGESAGEQHQRPQTFGGEAVLSLQAALPNEAGDDNNGESIASAGTGGRLYGVSRSHDEDVPLRGRFVQRDTVLLSGFPAREPSVEDAMIEDAVSMLGSDEQESFRMVYGEGLSYREAADRAGVSLGTIQYRLDKVKAAIRERLSGDAESAA